MEKEGRPCAICGSTQYEERYVPTPDDWEELLFCVECGAPEGEQVDTFDWSIYVDGNLFDLRYGVASMTPMLAGIRAALTHGDVEVKVHAR